MFQTIYPGTCNLTCNSCRQHGRSEWTFKLPTFRYTYYIYLYTIYYIDDQVNKTTDVRITHVKQFFSPNNDL